MCGNWPQWNTQKLINCVVFSRIKPDSKTKQSFSLLTPAIEHGSFIGCFWPIHRSRKELQVLLHLQTWNENGSFYLNERWRPEGGLPRSSQVEGIWIWADSNMSREHRFYYTDSLKNTEIFEKQSPLAFMCLKNQHMLISIE